MATTDPIWTLRPGGRVGPPTNFAAPGIVPDASTPPVDTPVLAFDGSADEHADWIVVVPDTYDGGGFTCSYRYAMDGTDGNIVEIEIRMFPLADASSILTADLGIDGLTAVEITDDPSANADEYNITATGGLSHANAGSPAAGATMIVRATRDISPVTNTDDLQLVAIYVQET